MTATPHSGREENFQLFMALLEPDRFEGRPTASGERADAADMMRRMIKEDLCKFDGTRLFPDGMPIRSSMTCPGPSTSSMSRLPAMSLRR
jgi:hypothetical protein